MSEGTYFIVIVNIIFVITISFIIVIIITITVYMIILILPPIYGDVILLFLLRYNSSDLITIVLQSDLVLHLVSIIEFEVGHL